LNNETFDLWQSPTYTQNKYYATKDSQQIPRRFALGDFIKDYIVNSYNDGAIDPKVFLVPSYCTKQCNGIRNENNLRKNSVENEK
jgi:hypothetical protein